MRQSWKVEIFMPTNILLGKFQSSKKAEIRPFVFLKLKLSPCKDKLMSLNFLNKSVCSQNCSCFFLNLDLYFQENLKPIQKVSKIMSNMHLLTARICKSNLT